MTADTAHRDGRHRGLRDTDRPSRGRWHPRPGTSTTMVLVDVTRGGSEGIGWTYGSGRQGRRRRQLGDVVASARPHERARHARGDGPDLRNLGRPGVAASAISAVDIALWDLKARLLGLPLGDLLGRARAEVPVYGSGGFTTYDDATTAGSSTLGQPTGSPGSRSRSANRGDPTRAGTAPGGAGPASHRRRRRTVRRRQRRLHPQAGHPDRAGT